MRTISTIVYENGDIFRNVHSGTYAMAISPINERNINLVKLTKNHRGETILIDYTELAEEWVLVCGVVTIQGI